MSLRAQAGSFLREHKLGGILVFIGLLHGLIYISIIPPWQHYDEPGHFEYAWLIANRGKVPNAGEYNQSMRREVAASMIEHSFFEGMDVRPNLLSIREPIWIGIAQTGDQPLYYWLVALPLKVVKGSDVLFQMYLGRLVSLILYLITIAAFYGLTVELTPPRHVLRWMAPAAAALLPAFTDLMTAINNDVGAVAFFTLFLWAGVVLILRGFSWFRFGAMLVFALLCFWTKSTVAIAIPLAIIPTMFSLARGERIRWAWAGLFLAMLLLSFVSLSFQEPMYWYRSWHQMESSRVRLPLAPHSSYAFEVVQTPDSPLASLFQLVPRETAAGMAGKTFTLGGWVWSDVPTAVRGPGLAAGGQYFSTTIEAGPEPVFTSITATFPQNLDTAQIMLAPYSTPVESTFKIFYDGVILVEGSPPQDTLPQFHDSTAQNGVWADEPFQNLLRNPTAARGWFRVRTPIETLVSNFFPDRPSLILASIPDWQATGWYYTGAAENIFRTFWAKFGWGHIPLEIPFLTNRPYRWIAAFTVLGLLGAGIFLVRQRKKLSWPSLFFLFFALAFVWFSVLVRGISSISGVIFIPAARYGYPVVAPTLLVLAAGWYELLRLPTRKFAIKPEAAGALYLSFFVLLSVFSIYSVVRFF